MIDLTPIAAEAVKATATGVGAVITALFGALAIRINNYITAAKDAVYASRVNAAVQATAQEVVSEERSTTWPRETLIQAKLSSLKPGTQRACDALRISKDTMAARISGAAAGLVAAPAPPVPPLTGGAAG